MSRPPFAKAGWSRTEITPPLGILLGGRGMVLSEAESVRAPLVAQVLALEDQERRRLLLVSLDLIGLSSALTAVLRQRLAAIAGIAPGAVLLNASHTHSGPFTHYADFATSLPRPATLAAYETWLVEQLVVCAAGALQRLTPASVERHDGQTGIGINRRLRNPDGIVSAGPNAAGEFAPDLFVLDIVQRDSGARAIAFSAACHPIIDCGWNRTMISPDFPGLTRDLLRQRLGPDTHVQFFQGACGNVRPRILADPATGRFRPCREEDTAAVAHALADDVEQTLQTPAHALELELTASEGWLALPLDENSTPDLAALAEGNNAPAHAARYWLEHPPAIWSRWQPWPVGLFTLARNCRVAWFGGEPLAEWQPFLRGCLKDDALMVWGYTGESTGYLPMDRHLPEGGYETSAGFYRKFSPWRLAPGIDATVRDRFSKLG